MSEMKRIALGIGALTSIAILFTSSFVQAQETKAPAEPTDKGQVEAKVNPRLARLAGSYADLPQDAADFTSLLLEGVPSKPKSFYTLVEQLQDLASTQDKGDVLLDLSGNFSLNMVQVAELERSFQQIRKSGKTCYAYLENASSIHLQLASLCDRVIMADMGMVDFSSPALSLLFMKDAMDLLGVHMQVVRCGDFKGAVEPYQLSAMSDHLRQHYKDMLQVMNADVVRRIAEHRNLESKAVRELQSQRLFTAKQAKEAGLIDDIVSWQGAKAALAKVKEQGDLQFDNLLKKRNARQEVSLFTLLSIFNPKSKLDKIPEGLVVLHLSGTLMDGNTASANSIVSGPTVKLIQELTNNAKVKGVVVRVNSPGGSATASEAILLALKDLSKAKPVAFSMGATAASGGYYVTCLGRPIFAEEATITGSIGVFGMKPNLGALMRRLGLREEIVALDAGATFTSLEQPWSEEQQAVMQNMVNEVYQRFTDHVCASRKMAKEDLLQLAGGRVWSGRQALENKLVDHLGGLQDALGLVATQAGLAEGYAVSHRPKPLDPFAMLMQQMMEAKALVADLPLPALQRQAFGLNPSLQILLQAIQQPNSKRIWALAPQFTELR